MNDWDNQDNFPPDDDDEEFDWLDEDEEDSSGEDDTLQEWQMPRPSRAGSEFEARMDSIPNDDAPFDWSDEDDDEELQSADTAPLDMPDWMQGMELPEVNDEDIAAAKADALGPDDSEDDETDDFLFGSSDDEDETDDFLFGSSDDEDETDDFLFGSSDDEDETDDFLFGSSSEDEVDDFLFGSSGEDDEVDDFLFDSSDDEDAGVPEPSEMDGGEWGDLGKSFTDEFPAVEDDEEEPEPVSSSEWGDLGKSFTDEFPAVEDDEEPEPVSSGWGDLDDLDEDDPVFASLFGAETPEESPEDAVPDWLSGAEDEIYDEADEQPDELDFLSELDEEPEESPGDLDDLLDDYETEEDLSDLLAELEDDSGDVDDLLSELDLGDSDDVELDDLLAELEGDDEGDLDDLLAELEGDSGDDGLDELLLGLDKEEAVSQADELDFLDAIGEEEEAISQADDLDFLDTIGEDEEAVSDADDLDFLDTIGEDEEAISQADELDFLDAIGEDEEAISQADDLDFLDAIGEDEEVVSQADELDFLNDIDEEEDEEAAVKPSPDDWLSALDEFPTVEEEGEEEEVNLVDSLIASFDTEEHEEEDIDEAVDIFGQGNDLDAYFDAMEEEQAQQEQEAPQFGDGDAPDWLQELAQDVDEMSAAAIVRERRDRSLDDLEDRLLDLRERGLEISSETEESPEDHQRMAKVVPNLDDALTPARIKTEQSFELVSEAHFSPEQEKNAAVLQALVGSSLGAGVLTGMGDEAAAPRRRSRRRRFPLRVDRFIISMILVIAVITPFIYSGFTNVAILPPNEFSTESPELVAFTMVENLGPEDLVLVAAEYGAAGARELDTSTRALLEHMFVKGAKPVLVSSNAIGLLRTDNIMVELMGEANRNIAYYDVGLLPGGNVSLRDLSINTPSLMAHDWHGAPTGLHIDSLDDFKAIILIAESGEIVRSWMEQVAPTTSSSFIVVTGQAASPLAIPYVRSADNAVALLTSYNDAYTYQQMALAIYNPATFTPTYTATFTQTPSPTATFTPTFTPTATNTATNTATPSDTPTASNTPIVSDTPTASDTPTPSDTPTATASNTATATEVPNIDIGTIVSDGRINVRDGAGSGFPIVAALDPGEQVRVIGHDDAAGWTQVVLPDGSQGWVADFLIEIQQMPENEWDGAFLIPTEPRVFMKQFDRLNQSSGGEDPQQTILVGRNISGITIQVFDNPVPDENVTNVIGEIRPNGEFVVLEQGDEMTQILFEGDDSGNLTEGFVENRLISVSERNRNEVDFAPTITPTASITPTPSNTPTATATLSPTPTEFFAQVTPTPLSNPQARSGAHALGLLAAIVIIALGNIFWVRRWMEQRN